MLPSVEARSARNLTPKHGFASTHWSAIRACAGNNKAAQIAREALCRDYWYPLYAHIRRSDYHGNDAEDLAQDFFADILSRPWFERADESKGRFRAFLLTSLNNYLRDRHDHRNTEKRGGAFFFVPLDMGSAESRYSRGSVAAINPAEIYEVEWAAAIVETSLERLEKEYVLAGKETLYKAIKPYLTTPGDGTLYEATAKTLETSLSNIKVAVHRLRKDYGAILREEVARTIARPEDVEGEMRYMRALFAVT